MFTKISVYMTSVRGPIKIPGSLKKYCRFYSVVMNMDIIGFIDNK